MNTFIYIIIFIIGITFGSFYTLAVYRIPKKIDIVHTHSFCPNCGHKLGFWELIPVFSYIFLRGKCKNCKQKIRIRYLLLEVFSGITFVLIAYCLKINTNTLNIDAIIKFGFIILYLVAIYIIAGIDKENKKIEKGVLYYSYVVSCCYIIYLCLMDKTNIYRYAIYLITLIILLSIDNIKQKKEAKDSYLIETLMLIIVMVINTGEITVFFSLLTIAFAIGITKLIYTIKNSLNKSKKEEIDIHELYKFGYLLGLTNIILFIGKLYYLGCK